MRYIHIPGTELITSAICLGGGNLGSTNNQQESFTLLDSFIEQGGNFLDTAKIYADWLPGERSISEKTIGAWMRQRGNRQQVIVATKGAHPDLAAMHIPRLSPGEIVADLEASLQHLGTDVIDLYWLHRDDPARPVEEIIDTLNSQVAAGKIRYFGCSNWRAGRIQAAQAYAQAHGLMGFAGRQMLWSLAHIDMDANPDKTLVNMDGESFDYHKSSGLAAIPYSSQAGGLFNKMAQGSLTQMNGGVRSMYPSAENEGRFKHIQKVSGDTGFSITQIALGYLLSQPFAVIPIVGCHTLMQLKDSLSAGDISLDPAQVKFLDRIDSK
jgi:aryl-alcohol dehydrogenase-like predicted oxidoreductase